jgi:hypothetical protein
METPAENDGVTRVRLKPKPNNKRALVQVDHLYQIGRRVKELVDVFRSRIPDADDPITATAIRRCAANPSARTTCCGPAAPPTH